MLRKYYGHWNCVFSHVRITTTNNHCILMKGIYALSFLSPLLLCCREVEKSKLLDWRFFPYLIIRFQQFYQRAKVGDAIQKLFVSFPVGFSWMRKLFNTHDVVYFLPSRLLLSRTRLQSLLQFKGLFSTKFQSRKKVYI